MTSETNAEEFIPLKRFPDFSITRSGIVKHIPTEQILNKQKGPMGYPMIRMTQNNSFLINERLHVLLAETFIEKPQSVLKLVVNHKDGNKENHSLENLEWVTYAENNVHAFETGLRQDNKRTTVIDLFNNTVFKFRSIQEAGKWLDLTGGAVLHRIKAGRALAKLEYYKYTDPVIYGRFLVDYEDDTWTDKLDSLNSCKLTGLVSNGEIEVVAVNLKTEQAFIYKDAETCGLELNVSYGIVIKSCENFKRKVPRPSVIGDFAFVYAKDLVSVDRLKKLINEYTNLRASYKSGGKKPLMVIATNKTTNESFTYDSLEICATSIGSTKASLKQAILTRGGFYKEWFIKYLK